MAVPFERRAGAWPRMLSITRSDAGAAGAGKTESHAPGGMMIAREPKIVRKSQQRVIDVIHYLVKVLSYTKSNYMVAKPFKLFIH